MLPLNKKAVILCSFSYSRFLRTPKYPVLTSTLLPQAAVLATQNSTELHTDTMATQLDNMNSCQLPSQSQVQSQIPLLQSSDSQRPSPVSASSTVPPQKKLSSVAGSGSQGLTEAIKEVKIQGLFFFFIIIRLQKLQ